MVSKYTQTPWIDKVIEEYKGVGKEQECYVQTMAIAELVALTKLEKQLQTEQNSHNALRERLKELEWCTGDENQGFNWCPACLAVEGKSHTDSCWLSKAIKEVD